MICFEVEEHKNRKDSTEYDILMQKAFFSNLLEYILFNKPTSDKK